MNTLPRSTTINLNQEQHEKLRKISFAMRLNKDSLVNFWLSRGLKFRTPHLTQRHKEYVNSFFLLNDVKLELQRASFSNRMGLADIAHCYLKEAINETHDFLNSPLHTENFQKIIHHFEDTTEIRKWPNVSFRNLRNIPQAPTEKSDKKIYVIVDRKSPWDGNQALEQIDSIYTSLELAMARLKDLQRGKDIHNYYGHHIDSYHENGSMDKCCMDINKSGKQT